MIPRDDHGNIVPLSTDLNRHFLYVRYNADLSQTGLDNMGLGAINSADVREMDSVKYLAELQQVGKTASEQVNLDHFGSFV